jgi:hypothetical protein
MEVIVAANDEVLKAIQELRLAVARLEAERDCAAVLARYGYYADHGRREEWINLFTEDGVMDLMMYHGEDLQKADPAHMRHTRFVGHEHLRELINSPAHASIEGHSHHKMSGPPATFRLIDDNTAIMVTYAVVYAKDAGDIGPSVQYLSHSMNRWTFRKVGDQWYIAEDIRRRMGSPDSGALFEDF